jgi:indole-3-glycerol phosphate synthase
MKNILQEIVKNSRRELEVRKQEIPYEKIQKQALQRPRPLDLATALWNSRIRLIAEVKKASPSKGVICQDFNPIDIARTYAENHAAAISVLTDSKYFQGSLDYLSYIDCALGPMRPPLLRKDFIFDPYQVYEARAYGADALLLIVAILDFKLLESLLDLAHHLHMRCLVEVHNEEEVNSAILSGARIIGINNRDLQTFNVDIKTTARLRPLISRDHIIVSESGIRSRADMDKLQEWGVNAALVGESLIASGNIPNKMRELLYDQG